MLMKAATVLVVLVAVSLAAPQRYNNGNNRGRQLQQGGGNNAYNGGANNRGKQLNQGRGNGGGGGGGGGGRGKQLQQGGGGNQPQHMDYNFEWNVDAQEYDNYYGHQEAASSGRVEGSYYVWLPDQRLMRVDYYVDGDSGYVPTITYEDAYSPAWGSTAFGRR